MSVLRPLCKVLLRDSIMLTVAAIEDEDVDG